MKTPPMVATVTETPTGYVVAVEHADHQSWSRAVYPRANKAVMAHMRAKGVGRHLNVTDSKYSHAEPAPRRSVSTFTYTFA